MLSTFFLITAAIFQISCAQEQRMNAEAQVLTLVRQRYHGYGLARPVAEVEKVLNVSMLFVINEFLGIDELTGTMKVTAVIRATWQDDLLRWNPQRYESVEAVPMQIKDVFLPTIVKDGNGGTMSSIFVTGAGQNDRDINAMVWVKYNGQVEAMVTGQYLTNCKLNLDDFPFDSHECKFTFKVWRFDEKRISLTLDDEQKASEVMGGIGATKVNINANPNFVMTSITSATTSINTTNGRGDGFDLFSAIIYHIKCDRRTDFYFWNVIMPTLAMVVMLLATFIMPFGADRCLFCITLVLTLNIFQQALSGKIPVTAEVIPFVRQINVQVLSGIFVTMESCLVAWIANKNKVTAVPEWLRKAIPKLRNRDSARAKVAEHGRRHPLFAARQIVFGQSAKKTSINGSRNAFPPKTPSTNLLNQLYPGQNGDKAESRDDVFLDNNNINNNNNNNNNAEATGFAHHHQSSMDSSALVNAREYLENEKLWQQMGDWLEVAQVVDMFALMAVITCIFILPFIFYRHMFASFFA